MIETEDQPEEEGPPGGGAGAEGGGPGGGGPRRRITYKRPPELEDGEWEADLRALAMECQARGRHMMEEEWRLGEEQGADHDLVKKTVGMLAEEDARVGAWLAAMQKAEDLDLEKTCAKKATEEEVFLQTKTYALADVKKEIEAWRPSMVEERAALLKSGVVRAIKPREAEELKREALEKGIPYDRCRERRFSQERPLQGAGNAEALPVETSCRSGRPRTPMREALTLLRCGRWWLLEPSEGGTWRGLM